jgi:hypothetical protein
VGADTSTGNSQQDYAADLISALTKRGINATPTGRSAVVAKNIMAEPAGDDPRGQLMSPGLRQEVICRPRSDSALWWHWVWSGPDRNSPPEYEPLCPIEDVETAAARITRVLAVPFAESGASL